MDKSVDKVLIDYAPRMAALDRARGLLRRVWIAGCGLVAVVLVLTGGAA